MTKASRSLQSLALLPLVALTGCAGPGAVVSSTATVPSSVPLTGRPSPSTTEELVGAPGAAGRIVQCSGPVVGDTRAAHYEGEDTGTTPEAALDAARRWASWDGAQQGYSFAGSRGDRRLYLLEVDGVAKQALILRHGPALKGDGTDDTVTRWWLESWARCDYAELPAEVARQNGLQLWSDAAGRPQFTSAIVSFDFSAGCFPGMTALDLDGPTDGGRNEEKRTPVEYVRRPASELRSEYFTRPYREHVAVPADAIDSGFTRDGEHLWFSRDRGYAYVGSSPDAEAWPRAKRPIRCA